MTRPRVSRLDRLAWNFLVPILMAPASLAAQGISPNDSATTLHSMPDSLVDPFPVDHPTDLLTFEPGVTTTNQGELLLRGSKAGDAAIYLDGIPLLSAFRSTSFFGLTRSRRLESPIGVPPGAVQSISVTTGPMAAELSNGQAGAISILTHDGGGRLTGALGYETDEPFGAGASVGLNRLEGNLAGSVGRKLRFFAGGLVQGERSVGSGFDAEVAPIFVSAGPETTVAVPSEFGDPLADTTFVQVQNYAVSRGNCGEFAASPNPEIADNYGLDCQGSQTPLSPVSTYQMLGKLTYGFGADSRVSLLAMVGQSQNRNFEYGTLYNPAGVTGNRASSSLIGLTWHQPLTGSAERPLVLDANLSFQSDRKRSGPLTLDEERSTADPFGGFLVRPLDLRFDFDNFPVNEELLRNYRTNLVGSRRSPYDLENPAQYALIDQYRNNAYGLYNRDPIANVTFPEEGGPVGLLTLYRERRTVASANLGWTVSRSNQLQLGGELTRYSIDNYSHFLDSQVFSDVYLEKPIRLGLFVQDRLQFGAATITGGLRYDSYDTRARRPADFPRISSHPLYDPGDPDAFFTDDSLFPRDDSHSRVSPHIHATFSLAPHTTFRGGFAQQVQVPDFRLTLLGINTDFALTSTAHIYGQDLDFERSNIYELGARHAFGDNLILDFALYSKSIESDVTIRLVSRFDPLLGVSRPLTILDNGGTGRVRGLDVKLERRWGGMLAGWLGYSFQDSKVDVTSGVLGGGTVSVPAPESRPHSVTGAVALTIPEDWKQGSTAGAILGNVGIHTVFRVASGTPYTSCGPGSGNDFVMAPELCAGPLTEPINGSRLPTFKQLDLRLTKRFGPGGRFTGYIDARNALNFRNVLAVFAVTGTTSNPQEAAVNWAADSADLAFEAAASGALRSDGSIDLGEGDVDPRAGCSTWSDQAGSPAAPNCVYLIAAEERFGNGDHLFDVAEQRRASDALYRAVRGPQELTGPARRIRLGLEASF
jgi:hypothetical protein